MQIFRKPVEQAIQGDRVGICVTNFDSKQIERGIAASPDYVQSVFAVIIDVTKIRHYKGQIETGSRFHISIGHETVVGKVDLFGEIDAVGVNAKEFDFNKDYAYLDHYQDAKDEAAAGEADAANKKFEVKRHFALIDFADTHVEHAVLCTMNSLVIGSKLDTDIHLNQCRIAFSGRVLHAFTHKDYHVSAEIRKLKIFKEKSKEGTVERMQDIYTVIGKSLFKKETNIDLFTGLKVNLSTGEQGVIEGNFGQSGKFKVRISSKTK
jgi:selenocysteine-specific elongation factor